MASSYINLIEVADSTIASCDCYVSKLYIHVVFGWAKRRLAGSHRFGKKNEQIVCSWCAEEAVLVLGRERTFDELAAIYLTGCDFEGNDMILGDQGQQTRTR